MPCFLKIKWIKHFFNQSQEFITFLLNTVVIIGTVIIFISKTVIKMLKKNFLVSDYLSCSLQKYKCLFSLQISMTPNLFTVTDYEFKDTTANVEIVAQFLFGAQPVESITVQPEDNVRNLNASLPSPPLSFHIIGNISESSAQMAPLALESNSTMSFYYLYSYNVNV